MGSALHAVLVVLLTCACCTAQEGGAWTVTAQDLSRDAIIKVKALVTESIDAPTRTAATVLSRTSTTFSRAVA